MSGLFCLDEQVIGTLIIRNEKNIIVLLYFFKI